MRFALFALLIVVGVAGAQTLIPMSQPSNTLSVQSNGSEVARVLRLNFNGSTCSVDHNSTDVASQRVTITCAGAMGSITNNITNNITNTANLTVLSNGVAKISVTSAAGTVVLQNGRVNASVLAPVGGLPDTTSSYPAEVWATFTTGTAVSGAWNLQLASETAATAVQIREYSFCKYRTV